MASSSSIPIPDYLQGGDTPGGVASTDPLAELRDIHLPGPVDALPAPGWWILLLAVLIVVVMGLFWLFKRWRANRYRREALKELHQLRDEYRQHDDDALYLLQYQSLLKRVALTRFTREKAASLTGESWVRFLDRTSRSQEFSMGKGQILIDGNYSSSSSAELDVASLHELGVHWIRHHKPELAA